MVIISSTVACTSAAASPSSGVPAALHRSSSAARKWERLAHRLGEREALLEPQPGVLLGRPAGADVASGRLARLLRLERVDELVGDLGDVIEELRLAEVARVAEPRVVEDALGPLPDQLLPVVAEERGQATARCVRWLHDARRGVV